MWSNVLKTALACMLVIANSAAADDFVVLTPNAGTVMNHGQGAGAAWMGAPTGGWIRIDLLHNGQLVDEFHPWTANDGACNRGPVPVLWGSGTGYQVRLFHSPAQDAGQIDAVATSAPFEIRDGNTFVVFDPSGDTTLTHGVGPRVAQWTGGVPGGSVMLELYRGDAYLDVYHPLTDNDGWCSTVAPPSSWGVGNNYRVKLVHSDGIHFGWSEPFTVQVNNSPPIESQTVPATGETITFSHVPTSGEPYTLVASGVVVVGTQGGPGTASNIDVDARFMYEYLVGGPWVDLHSSGAEGGLGCSLFASNLRNDDGWGSFTQDHVYLHEFVGNDQPLRLRMIDGDNSSVQLQNNRGSYTVQLLSGHGRTFRPDHLQILDLASALTLRRGDPLTVRWSDAGQHASVQFFLDPEPGDFSPWNDADDVVLGWPPDARFDDRATIGTDHLEPGDYLIWARASGAAGSVHAKAPGVVTILPFGRHDEPSVRSQRIEIGGVVVEFVHQGANADKLFLVTHGINVPWQGHTTDHSWIELIADGVATHVAAAPTADEWDVAYVDWSAHAGSGATLPDQSALMAWFIGMVIGDQVARSYSHVEIAAHSAGTWMAEGLSRRLSSLTPAPTTQAFLLDAYAAPFLYIGPGRIFGDAIGHCFNAFDRGDWGLVPYYRINLPFTQELRDTAFNVDCTCRRQSGEVPEVVGWDSQILWPTSTLIPLWEHGSPWAWFLDSVRHADASWLDDFSYQPYGVPRPTGFKMSRAWNGGAGWSMNSLQADYPEGDLFRVECDESDPCVRPDVIAHHREPIAITVDVIDGGGSGTHSVNGGELVLESGLDRQWAGLEVPIDRRGSFVTMDVKFEGSSPGAEGFLTIHWQGEQYYVVDERFVEAGEVTGGGFFLGVPQDLLGGILSFRLDANAGPQSRVIVSNVRSGVTVAADVNGDCAYDASDLCAWASDPIDIDGDASITLLDQQLLADALGVSDADANRNGTLDVCEPRCRPDISGSADPSDPSYGVSDGLVDASDFFYYLDLFVQGDPAADWSGSADPSSPDYGQPDGLIDASDFFYFLDLFAQGCP